MKVLIIMTALVLLAVGTLVANEEPHREAYEGFSIAPMGGELRHYPEYRAVVVVFTDYADPNDITHPNVQAEVAEHPEGKDAAAALAEIPEFAEAMNAEIVSTELVDERTYTVRMRAIWMQEPLEWYVRVILHDGKAYMASAAAGVDQWEKFGDTLNAVVDSLRLEDDSP